MSIDEYARLSIAVLRDWRVIAVAIGAILIWAALRYVGLVYYSRSRIPARKKGAAKPGTGKGQVRQ